MRFLRHSLMGLVLVSLTFGLLAWAGLTVVSAVQERMAREARQPPQRERVFSVSVLEAEASDVVPVLEAYGEVESRRTLEIRAGTGGVIVELAPEFVDGGEVSAGQRLALIDPADAEAALANAESDLADVRAEVEEAALALEIAEDNLEAARAQADLRDRALQRQRDIRDRGVGSDATVETAELAAQQAEQTVLNQRQAVAQARTRVANAQTALSRAEIARNDAQRALDDTVITADFAGSLSDVSVVAGRRVSANEQLAQLVDGDALDVVFRVSTSAYARLLDEAGRLRPTPVEVHLDAGESRLTAVGQITRDSAAVGEGQTGRLLYARLDETSGLKPGDFVTVNIREPELQNVVRLPAGAYGADGMVLALADGERLEPLPVTLLRRQGDDVLVRGEGLVGREIVTQRSPLLGAGIKVDPTRIDRESGAALPQAPEMVALSDERRAQLRAFVEGNDRMPDAVKTRLLTELEAPEVSAQTVERLEGRMGG